MQDSPAPLQLKDTQMKYDIVEFRYLHHSPDEDYKKLLESLNTRAANGWRCVQVLGETIAAGYIFYRVLMSRELD